MPDRIVKKLGPRKSIIIAFLLLTLIFFGTVGILAWIVIDQNQLNHKTNTLAKESKNLGQENKQRILEIQHNRLEACRSTYTGVYKIFRPFFPKPHTNQERNLVNKFKRRINKLKQGCYKQITPLNKKKE
jgi:predicted PurR-regulated permease PerM